MNLQDRALSYNNTFPKYSKVAPMVATDRWLFGAWIIGNMYGHKKGFYGAYPVGYLKRIHALFPDAVDVLHLFSGVVDKGNWMNEATFDVDASLNPDIIGDVRNMEQYIPEESYDLVVADPPYEKSDFEKYGIKSFCKRRALKQALRVVKRGGYVVWLDTRMPMYSKKECLLVGTIGVIVSTNTRFRLVSIFRRNE